MLHQLHNTRRTRRLHSAVLPHGILNETIACVTDILGRELNAIAVERAVIGLYFTRALPDGLLDLLAEGDPAPHFLGRGAGAAGSGC
jgi:hypothetical protein